MDTQKVMADMFNAIWTAYKLGETYIAWRESDPDMDKDFIITDKCSLKLPETMRIPFKNLYRAINN